MADPYAPTTSALTLPTLSLADTLPPLTMGSMLSMPHYDASGVPSPLALPIGTPAGPSSRKRRASTPPADEGLSKRPRTDGALDGLRGGPERPAGTDGKALAEELAQELQCGCCAATIYRPVISRPCEHFFCGSCIALWIRNGGHNCPACRSVSESCTPSRSLENMANILIKHDPSQARAPREREQADEVYKGGPLRIPQPRAEPSLRPQPLSPDVEDYARPCPHCAPGNEFRWTCPMPVRDPNEGLEGAWHLDDGTPPGHGWCGNCEDLLAVGAPSTTRCDFCLVAFCGMNLPQRCCALPLRDQCIDSRFSNAIDPFFAEEIYKTFDRNAIEAEEFIMYLLDRALTPKDVYHQIIQHILTSPEVFTPLIECDIFLETHSMPSVWPENDDPAAPRENICQACATEVFIWGVHDWWERERAKVRRVSHVLERR